MTGEGWMGCLAMAVALVLIAVGVGGLGARRARARRQAAQDARNRIAALNSQALRLLDEVAMTENESTRRYLWGSIARLKVEMANRSVQYHREYSQGVDPWNHEANLQGALREQGQALQFMHDLNDPDAHF